jgi:hypothetical protein
MTDGPRGTKEQQTDYLAYLLRLWRMRGEGAAGWRASIESPGGGESQLFASLDELFLFLRRQAGARAGPTEAEDGSR